MDDARLGDGMTLDGISSQLATIQSDLTTLKSDVSSLKTDVSTLKTDVSTLKTDVSTLRTDVSTLRTDLTGVKSDVRTLDAKIDSKVDALAANMKVEFEETRRMIKLGFESVAILDERIGRRFDEAERQHGEHKTLLEAAIVRLRRDVQPSREPARRRRR